MSDIAIRIEHLGKQYRIGGPKGRFKYKRFTETAMAALTAPLQRLWAIGQSARSVETFWALRDVSFEIERGEAVGIIGANGAGKSTLLKVLSRITEPTEGRVQLHGRVGSLLEVGTGFHPELTGRENIYLNGAILGMRRPEIAAKFDEIVAFAEVDQFLDTPVKHYSSGMYVRLAFAVAAHLEPQILLVDEVLAVGDAAFQKKCLGKMGEVTGQGRTVLFVSHNMATIQSLCSRAVLLNQGKIVTHGTVDNVISSYLAHAGKRMGEDFLASRPDRENRTFFHFTGVQFFDAKTMTPVGTLISGQSALVRLKYSCTADHALENVALSFAMATNEGVLLFACRSDAIGKTFHIQPGQGFVDCSIPKWPLSGGRYAFHLVAFLGKSILDWVDRAGFVDVETGDFYNSGVSPALNHQSVFIDFGWEDPINIT